MIKEAKEIQDELINQIWEGITPEELHTIVSKWNYLSFPHKQNILKIAIPRGKLRDPEWTSLDYIFTEFRSLFIHPSIEELKNFVKILKEGDWENKNK